MSRDKSDQAVFILLFLRIGKTWRLRDDDLAILAGVKPSTLVGWRRSARRCPSDKTVERIDLLLEIELRAQPLIKDDRDWLSTSPTSLANRSPLSIMKGDGNRGLLQVRDYLVRFSEAARFSDENS